MSESKRAALKKHFESSGKSKKQLDLEDPEDIYDHTKAFFQGNSPAVDKVEVGQRKLRA